MIAIVCADAKNGIGKDGKLLVSIPEDMKFFREATDNSVVIMGRKTLFSLKNKEPLKNRINVVLTNNAKKLRKEYEEYDNIFFVQNLTELNEICKQYNDKKVFLIGGASIYDTLIDFCSRCYVTRLNKVFDADTFLPDLEERGFILESESEEYTYKNIKYKFASYIKKDG